MYLTSPRQKKADFIDVLCLGLFCMPRHGLKLHLEQRPQEQICRFGLILENLKKLIQCIRLQGLFLKGICGICRMRLLVLLCFLIDSQLKRRKHWFEQGSNQWNVRGDPTILKEGVRLGDFATTLTLRLLNVDRPLISFHSLWPVE